MEIVLSNLQAVVLHTDAEGKVSSVQRFGEAHWWQIQLGAVVYEDMLPTDRDRVPQIVRQIKTDLPANFTFTLRSGKQCNAIVARGQQQYHWLVFPLSHVQHYPEPDLSIYRKIFELLPLDAVIFDPDHRYRYVSPTAVQDPEVRRWIIGKTDFDWVRKRGRPTAIAEQRRRYFQQALEQKSIVSWVEEFPAKDGRILYFLRFYCPITNERGEVEWVAGYAVDLTEQIVYQRELEQLNRELQAILQAIQDPLIVLTNTGTIELVNAAAERLLQGSRDALVGKKLVDVLSELQWSPENFACVQKTLDHATTEAYFHCPEALQVSDGLQEKVYTLYSAAVAAEDGTYWGTVLVFRDVTEEYQKTKELRESEERFRNLVEHSPVPILIHSEGKVVYYNPAAAAALALPDLQAGLGRSPMDFVHPDYRDLARQRIQEVYGKYQAAPAIEEKLLRADGTVFEAVVMAMPVRWKGKPASQVVFYDVSRQKTLERELRRLNQVLEAKVEERTAELEAALERLKDALLKEQELNMMKSRFISLVSHEFRTPLTGIISSAELLLRYADRLPEKERKRHLQNILRLGQNLNELLTEVLHLGKIETGKYQPLLEPLDVPHIVEEIIKNFEPNYPDHIIQFNYDPRPFPVLMLDKIVLRHVVQNLVSNALKYSPPHTRVDIMLQYAEGQLVLEVCDQGIGIPKSELPHIFQPFHRARNAQLIEGTGLGLAITQRLVTLCGGSIQVQSEEGEGSCFTVRLPAKLAEEVAAASSES